MRTAVCLIIVCMATGCRTVTHRDMDASSSPQAEQARVFEIDRSTLKSSEWKQAIRASKSHMSKFGGYYSLIRIVLENPRPQETIRANITKIKKLTSAYHGGGSQFQDTGSREFVFVQHIMTARRRDGQDPLLLSSPTRGTNTVWISVPSKGVLGIVGDIHL